MFNGQKRPSHELSKYLDERDVLWVLKWLIGCSPSAYSNDQVGSSKPKKERKKDELRVGWSWAQWWSSKWCYWHWTINCGYMIQWVRLSHYNHWSQLTQTRHQCWIKSWCFPLTSFVTPAKYQNCEKRGIQKSASFFCGVDAKFWQDDFRTSGSLCTGILGCFFYMLKFSNKRCSNSHEITSLVDRDKRHQFSKKISKLKYLVYVTHCVLSLMEHLAHRVSSTANRLFVTK